MPGNVVGMCPQGISVINAPGCWQPLCSTWLKPVALQALSEVLLLGDPIHRSSFKDLPKHLEMFHTKEILGSNLKNSVSADLSVSLLEVWDDE